LEDECGSGKQTERTERREATDGRHTAAGEFGKRIMTDRKPTKGIVIAGMAVAILVLWGVGHIRTTGLYSHRSHAVEPFGGSFLSHLQLDGDGTGKMWQTANPSTDFNVDFTWTESNGEVNVTVPQWSHWSYSYFNSPGTHRFRKTWRGIEAVGRVDDGILTLYGVTHGMAPKVFAFGKDILQF